MAKGVVFQDCSFLRSSLEIVDAAVEIVSYVTAKLIIKQSSILINNINGNVHIARVWFLVDTTMVNYNIFVWGTHFQHIVLPIIISLVKYLVFLSDFLLRPMGVLAPATTHYASRHPHFSDSMV